MPNLDEIKRQLGSAIQTARDVGEKMRRNPSQTARLQEQFDRAFREVDRLKLEVQRLEIAEIPTPFLVGAPTEATVKGLPPEMHAVHSEAFSRFLRFGGIEARAYMTKHAPARRSDSGDRGRFLYT